MAGVLCQDCPLQDTPYVHGEGSRLCKFMVVGTAPGLEEEKYRKPFVGSSGQLVRDLFDDIGITPFFTNVIKRRPLAYDGTHRKPSKRECWRCGSHLIDEIVDIRPNVILTLGQMPLQFLFGNTGTVSEIRGLPLKAVRCQVEFKVIPTYDPSFVQRRGGLLSKTGDEWITDIITAVDNSGLRS